MKDIQGIPGSSITSFWQWFSLHAEEFGQLLEHHKTETLYSEIDAWVKTLHPGLRWEAGPGLVKPYSLTITFGGDPWLTELAKQVVRAAPVLANWEFYSSKQRRKPPPVILFGKPPREFIPSEWRFSVVRRDRIDLTFFDDLLASVDEKTALGVVFVYLDALLGEDEVEKKIGDIRVQKPAESVGSLPICELPRAVYSL